jgi:UDP-N-acetylmuramoyl-tripeptide--D-alanyl-D-alanine ligase
VPKLGIQEIAGVIRGSLENVPEDQKNLVFSDFHFDTRLIGSEGTLFFALKTQDNDGHRFVRDLDHKKGVGAVVSKDFDAAGLTLPLIRVDDPLAAAHQLAVHVRNKFRKTKYIGVTGSAGKTTTKELIYQLLSHKYKTHRSHENWNNWIGLPFSLLKMTGEEEAAVFELAMSDPGIGEIDLLADILRPDVAVILNVYPVHLEFLKSLDNIAAAKSEILNHLAAGDVGFINGDSQPLRQAVAHKKGRKVFFGKSTAHNDIILKEVIREKVGTRLVAEFYGIKTEFSTHVINRVLSENLFVAVVVCQHLGMKHFEVQEALANVKPLARRGEIYRKNGFTIIDETYNSNPEALKKALSWVDQEFQPSKGKKIAVLGDMLELGDGEKDFHFEAGAFFSGLHFDFLVTVGRRAEKIAEGALSQGYAGQKVKMCADASEAGHLLKGIAGAGSVVLLKASRGIALERALLEFFHD